VKKKWSWGIAAFLAVLLVVGVVQQLVWQSFRYQTVLNLPSTFWAIAAIKLLFLLGKPAVVLDLIERLPKIKGNYYTEMLFLKILCLYEQQQPAIRAITIRKCCF
jgi:hypothetical protein